MNDIVIEGGMVLTMDGRAPIEDGRVCIVKGKIASVGPRVGETPASREIIRVKDGIVMPALINGHTHLGMTLYRGLADDVPLQTWLKEIIFPIETKWISAETTYFASLLGCAEMIRSGTTFFNDMYYFEAATAKAAHTAGIGGNVGPTFIDAHLEGGRSVEQTMLESVEAVKPYPRVRTTMAPHALYSLTDERVEEVCRVAKKYKLRINMHVSETAAEMQEVLARSGKTPVAHLESFGFWENGVTAAHVCCLTPEDIKILGKYHAGISHNPESNMKLGSPIAPVAELRKAGARVAIGTDSVASNNNLDLFGEASTAAKLQSFKYGPGVVDAEAMVRMLTAEGAAAVGMGDSLGQISPGMSGDVIVIDTNRLHLQPMHRPYSLLVYSAGGSDVRDVISAGKIVMRDRKITTFDEEALLDEVKQWRGRFV